MKKIFLAIAAVAALASCSKSEIAYEQEDAQIAISPVAANRTKAMVSGTEFPAEDFMVWAYYKQIGAGTGISAWQAATTLDQQTYIDEKPFEPSGTEGLWAGKIPYYWPKLGSLLFVGYYPATEAMADMVSYQFTSSVNKMTVAGFTPGDYQTTGFVNNATGADHVEDFMYFNMTPASCDGSTVGADNSVTSGYQIDVHFRHALSWISVVLAKDASTPDEATITVKSVTFTDVKTTGTGVVDNSPVAPATNEIAWDTTGSADADVNVWTGNKVIGDAETLEKQPVVIPQGMAGNLVVTYVVSSEDGSSFEETKTIALADINSENPNWEPGQKYTYTITIGTTEILIDPAIVDWVPVTPSVPVE